VTGRDLTNELTSYSGTRLLALLRAHAVSPVEVVAAHLRRADELNPRLNAIVTFAPDAVERARAAEQIIMRGGAVPPLCGLPVTIKDTIATRGLRTTSGSRLRADYVPERDAPAVARLRAAGAIIIGKTNVCELALDYTSENPVFGRTSNPHDPARTPGGSSGGAAAAISACLSTADVGSDLAGSIRIPAHFCGIAGLLPTLGRVPNAGHFPPPEGPFAVQETFGPMARTVADLALLFGVLADEQASAQTFTDEQALSEAARTLHGCRVAWYTDDGVAPVTAETRQAVTAAQQALGAAGLVPTEMPPPGIGRAAGLWLELFARAVQQQMCALHAGREELAGPSARASIARGRSAPTQTIDDYFGAWFERDQLRAALRAWMETTPLLVAPVGSVPAFAHDAQRVIVNGQELSLWRAFSYAQAFNVLGLPAVTLPAGRAPAGLPIGVQIVGRPRAEREVLAAARIVEAALGGWQPPPDLLSTHTANPL
jgi:Asp-tRNA(Asn)/Glu-tRNA(Gln) amidotransferase A subunit family amidase